MKVDQMIAAALLMAAMTNNAHAYIDPGTGSVVTTAILGFLAAIGYTFRKYMYRVKDWLSGGKGTHPKADKAVKTDQ